MKHTIASQEARIEEQRKQIEALTAQVGVLREAAQMAVEMIETESHERRHVRWKLKDAIATTPESALSEVRKAERERCAVIAGWQADGESAAREIRAIGDE